MHAHTHNLSLCLSVSVSLSLSLSLSLSHTHTHTHTFGLCWTLFYIHLYILVMVFCYKEKLFVSESVDHLYLRRKTALRFIGSLYCFLCFIYFISALIFIILCHLLFRELFVLVFPNFWVALLGNLFVYMHTRVSFAINFNFYYPMVIWDMAFFNFLHFLRFPLSPGICST